MHHIIGLVNATFDASSILMAHTAYVVRGNYIELTKSVESVYRW